MKPFIEKLSYPQESSFLAEIYSTPRFQVPWHQHPEYELILFLKGSGPCYVGNYIGRYHVNDVFFLGSNLPHTFQEEHKHKKDVTCAVVIQFREDCFGKDFLLLPECAQLKQLFKTSYHGLKLKDRSKKLLIPLIKSLPGSKGLDRIHIFCQCLSILSETTDFDKLSTVETFELNAKDNDRIDYIFQYTMENFRDSIQLPAVAKLAGMSVPAFCNYFKKRTKKTYISFVNELRVGYACKNLDNMQKTISEIGYESGYNSVTNFNKQFIKIKGEAPSIYRKNVLSGRIGSF